MRWRSADSAPGSSCASAPWTTPDTRPDPGAGSEDGRTRADSRGLRYAAPVLGLSVACRPKSTGSSRQRSNAETGRWGIPAGGRYAHIGP